MILGVVVGDWTHVLNEIPSKPESLQMPYAVLVLLLLSWGGAVGERLFLDVLCLSGELLENYICKQELTVARTKSV